MASNELQLAELLAPHLAKAGDKPALLGEDRQWSYAELAGAANALAARFVDAGLAGERIALMLPNGPEAVLCYLASFRSGALAVPLNTRYAPPEIEQALRRARPAWLIAHASMLERLDRVDPGVLGGARVLVAGDAGEHEPLAPLLAPGPGPAPASHRLDHPAVMFFTSGSTGPPKGVVHGHASALAMLRSTSEALGDVTSEDLVQVCEPLVHVSGFIATFTTLMAGGTVALYDGFDRDRYVAGLLEHRPTLICTHIDLVAQLLRAPDATGEWFSSLRGLYVGGDTLPGPLQRDFTTLAGQPIGVGWGMTEAIWLTVDRTAGREQEGCIGMPVGGAEVRAEEQTGELLVRGPMLMLGYWEDEPLTEATFTDGWLRTGDLGAHDEEGAWWFRGRLKDLIVRRTSKITPGEVEAALDQHPAVSVAAVIGAPDDREGQVPVAFVVLRPGPAVTADDLTAFVGDRIAPYKVPARIHFLDELPLTPSGKIAHRKLSEPPSGATAS